MTGVYRVLGSCVLKHVPGAHFMCAHACVRVYACVITRQGDERVGETAHPRVCRRTHGSLARALCTYNEICAHAHA